MTDSTFSKKTPLHLRLTHDQWIKETEGLSGAEIRVLYYVKTLDPFGDRKLSLQVTKIANDLKLVKGTVSKVLKKLDRLGLIRMILEEVKVRLSAAGRCFPQETEFPTGNPEVLQETQETCRKLDEPVGNEDIYKDRACAKTSSNSVQTLLYNQSEKIDDQIPAEVENKLTSHTPASFTNQSEPPTQSISPSLEPDFGGEEAEPLSKYTSSVQKAEELFKGKLYKWRNSKRRNDYVKGFVEYLMSEHLPDCDPWKKSGKKPRIGSANDWISVREFDEKGLASIENQWANYEQFLREKQEQQERSHGSPQSPRPTSSDSEPNHWKENAQKRAETLRAEGKEVKPVAPPLPRARSPLGKPAPKTGMTAAQIKALEEQLRQERVSSE